MNKKASTGTGGGDMYLKVPESEFTPKILDDKTAITRSQKSLVPLNVEVDSFDKNRELSDNENPLQNKNNSNETKTEIYRDLESPKSIEVKPLTKPSSPLTLEKVKPLQKSLSPTTLQEEQPLSKPLTPINIPQRHSAPQNTSHTSLKLNGSPKELTPRNAKSPSSDVNNPDILRTVNKSSPYKSHSAPIHGRELKGKPNQNKSSSSDYKTSVSVMNKKQSVKTKQKHKRSNSDSNHFPIIGHDSATLTNLEKGSSKQGSNLVMLPSIYNMAPNNTKRAPRQQTSISQSTSLPSIGRYSDTNSRLSTSTLRLSQYSGMHGRHGTISAKSKKSRTSRSARVLHNCIKGPFKPMNRWTKTPEKQKRKERRIISRIKGQYLEDYVNYTDGDILDDLPPNLSYLLRRYKITKIPPKLKPRPKKSKGNSRYSVLATLDEDEIHLIEEEMNQLDLSDMNAEEVELIKGAFKELATGGANIQDSQLSKIDFKDLNAKELENYENMAEKLTEMLYNADKTKYMSKEQRENALKMLDFLEEKLQKEKKRRIKRKRRINLAYVMRRKHIWTELERRRQENLAAQDEEDYDYEDVYEDNCQGCSYWLGNKHHIHRQTI